MTTGRFLRVDDLLVDAERAGPGDGVESAINVDPEIMGGAPVFRGTRVPIKVVIDYLAAGDTREQFLDDFPSVTRAQFGAVLREMHEIVDGVIRARAAR